LYRVEDSQYKTQAHNLTHDTHGTKGRRVSQLVTNEVLLCTQAACHMLPQSTAELMRMTASTAQFLCSTARKLSKSLAAGVPHSVQVTTQATIP